MKKFTIPLFLTLFAAGLCAQKALYTEMLKNHLSATAHEHGLEKSDVIDFKITDIIPLKGLDAVQIYVQQQINGIPVHGAVNSLTVKNDKIHQVGNAFFPNTYAAQNNTLSGINAKRAVELAAASVDLPLKSGYRPFAAPTTDQQVLYFESPDMLNERIRVQKEYLYKNGEFVLIWSVELFPKAQDDTWSVFVEQTTGQIVGKENYTSYCNLPETGNYLAKCEHAAHTSQAADEMSQRTASPLAGEGSYNVFPLPIESPNFGERSMVTAPYDTTASPFGWHDTDGVPGHEYTTTRGNNVIAGLDRDGNDANDKALPDGGADLIFDFPLDLNAEPDANEDAAIVNLFYVNNMYHDFAYRYGFDETTNFQSKNYTGQGKDGDEVQAFVQSNADGGSVNNANFSSPPDGVSGRMRMFVGENNAGSRFRIDAPISIKGPVTVGEADFGTPISETPVTGTVVRAFDATGNANFACREILNAESVNGNIALIDRGECFFERKARNAADAGAIGVIICNFEPSANGMIGADSIPDPGIPVVMIGSGDCAKIVARIDEGVIVTFQAVEQEGPALRDIAFDNGVIAHEYGHGLSIRSTGGPSISGCLNNNEQMGEGWSDFFALVTSTTENHKADDARGVGSFAFGQTADGPGIRRFPYSTDRAVNPQVYDDIIGQSAPHPIGEVWVGCLWDMYWAFVEQDGFDPDFINGNGGNNKAIQLVFDGMKMQPCSPGFIDGRDAILQADRIRYDGANQCLIWKAFADRGVGFGADQGSSDNANDGKMSFEIPPICIKELVIEQTVNQNINAGEPINVQIDVQNRKNVDLTNVQFEYNIPEGAALLQEPQGYEYELTGSTLSIALGDMVPGAQHQILFSLSTDPQLASTALFTDDGENRSQSEGLWETLRFEGTTDWFLEDFGDDAYSGTNVWWAEAIGESSDFSLQTVDKIALNAEQPVLRFFHFYKTEPGADGGIVQIREEESSTWKTLEGRVFKNDYRGKIAYSTFVLPNLEAFWGQSDGYVDSYFDLSEWKGKNIDIRFRFAEDASVAEDGEWRVDDIQVIDMKNYNGQACVSSDQVDMNCAYAVARGTIVEDIVSSIVQLGDELFSFKLAPNPAKNFVQLQFKSKNSRQVWLSVYSTDGKRVIDMPVQVSGGLSQIPFDISALQAGIYYMKILVEGQVMTKSLVVQP